MNFKLRPQFLTEAMSAEIVFLIVIAMRTSKSAIFWDVVFW
jgi:hypothetical protein